MATAKNNGISDLTCEDYIVGALAFLNCHACSISQITVGASPNRIKSDFFLQGRQGRVFLEY